MRLTHEGAANPGNLRPVKGQHTHAQSRPHAKQLVHNNIVRCCPANKRKDRQRLKEVSYALYQPFRPQHKQEQQNSPGTKKKINDPKVVQTKNRYLDMPLFLLRPPSAFGSFSNLGPPNIPIPSSSSSACNVFNSVHATKFWGHTMLAGQTKNRRHIPARPKPVSWVARTRTRENQ